MKATMNSKRFFSSFSIKLFIWFWLITVTSILTTRFISQQFSNEALTSVITHQATADDLRQLHHMSKRLKRSNLKNAIDLPKMKLYMQIKKNAPSLQNIWLKSNLKNTPVISLFQLPVKHQQAVSRYINQQKFSTAIISDFSHTQLIGPKLITINHNEYQLFVSRKQRRGYFKQLVQQMPSWARIAIPALISFILCLLLARSFSKPIQIIKQAAIQLGKGNFSTRVSDVIKRNDELGQLANSFNDMAEQLQQNQSAQQRLLGDISHELRSPMTRLQLALGLAQQQDNSQQVQVKYLQRCQLEVERLDQMITDVLVLSRLENTLKLVTPTQINMSQLVQRICDDEQFIATEKSITIKTELTKNVVLLADEALLSSAISNVLSNAVKYSPSNSAVQVSLTTDKQEITLIISDTGHGVPESAIEHLFTPFYRVNLARDRKTGGTGLGLAIAKQAILAHNGKIFAKNNASLGLSVTMQISNL